MKELLKKQRQLIAIYLVWLFTNIIVWSMSRGDTRDFWPFDSGDLTGYYGNYDFSEFLVYGIGPAVIFIAYLMFTKKD